jgi:hypothetical protein
MIYPIVFCSLDLALKLGMRPVSGAEQTGSVVNVIVPAGSFPVVASIPGRVAFLHWPMAYQAAKS